jgi:hypothetical protein
VVCGAGPLVHFARCDRLGDLVEFMRDLDCFVTRAACDEWATHAPPGIEGYPGVLEFAALDRLQELHAFSGYLQRLGESQFSTGNASTLAWAEFNDALAIVDDAVGAKTAHGHAEVKGTPWLIMRGMLTLRVLSNEDAAMLIDELLASSMLLPVDSGKEFVDWVALNPGAMLA